MQWPRTPTEKLLNEIFDCSSAQFLAISEALNDTNKRLAIPVSTGSENETENLDVILELFYAAEYILNGGGGRNSIKTQHLTDLKALVFSDESLLSLAIKSNTN
jgi:hypothetical protein